MLLLPSCREKSDPLARWPLLCREQGREVRFAPAQDQLTLLVALKGTNCRACLAPSADALSLLANKRSGFSGVLVFLDIPENVVGKDMPRGVRVLTTTSRSWEAVFPPLKPPVLVVVGRSGKVAGLVRLPAYWPPPEQLAAEWERFFALQE